MQKILQQFKKKKNRKEEIDVSNTAGGKKNKIKELTYLSGMWRGNIKSIVQPKKEIRER